MNYSTAVMLINESIKAVRCAYKPDEENKPHAHKVFKTLDHSLKVGDLVVVPSGTRYDRTVVKVMELDVDVDFDSPTELYWIVGKLDQSVFDTITAEEEKAIAVIKQGEKMKRRRDIRANMEALQVENLNMLPIANIASATVCEGITDLTTANTTAAA